jgi:hypothetical protein
VDCCPAPIVDPVSRLLLVSQLELSEPDAYNSLTVY